MAPQNQNQFAQSPNKGDLDMRFNPSSLSAQVDTTSAGGLVPAQAVMMVNSPGGVPKVVECAADTDDVYGFINYDLKSTTFEPLSKVELSALRGNFMYMQSSAAIARNAPVAIVVAGQKVVTATTGQRIIGRAYDEATGADQLIRVTIDLPGALAP